MTRAENGNYQMRGTIPRPLDFASNALPSELTWRPTFGSLKVEQYIEKLAQAIADEDFERATLIKKRRDLLKR